MMRGLRNYILWVAVVLLVLVCSSCVVDGAVCSCQTIPFGFSGAGHQVCCPSGQTKHGDGSACSGGGMASCAMYGNPGTPVCSTASCTIIGNYIPALPGAGNYVCCPDGMTKVGDGSACSGGGLPYCAMFGNAGAARCPTVTSSGIMVWVCSTPAPPTPAPPTPAPPTPTLVPTLTTTPSRNTATPSLATESQSSVRTQTGGTPTRTNSKATASITKTPALTLSRSGRSPSASATPPSGSVTSSASTGSSSTLTRSASSSSSSSTTRTSRASSSSYFAASSSDVTPVPTQLNRSACVEGEHDQNVQMETQPGAFASAEVAATPATVRITILSTTHVGETNSSSTNPASAQGSGASSSSSSGGSSLDVSWHLDKTQISGQVVSGPASVGRAFRVSSTEVDLILSMQDGASVSEEATVVIAFTKESFIWWTTCPSSTTQRVSLKLTTLVEPPVSREIITSSEVVGTAGGTLSLVSGSGALTLSTSRVASILAISMCAFSHTAPMGFTLCPLGLQIGAPQGAYYRGGIVGNFILLIIFTLIIGLVLVVAHYAMKDADWSTSCYRLHFPGILLLPYVLLLPGFVSASVALARHGVDDADIVIGAISAILCCAPVLRVAMQTGRSFDCTYIGEKIVKEENKEANIVVGKVEYHLLGLAHWKDRGRGFKYHWGVLFMDYCFERQWYVVVELLFTIVCAAIEGFKPTTLVGCRNTMIIYFVVAFIMLATVLGCRPCISTFNSLHMVAMAILLFVSTLLMMVGGLQGEGFEAASTTGAFLAVIITYFALLKSIVDIVATVQRRARALRNHRQNKKRRTAADNGNQQPLLTAPPEISTTATPQPPVLPEVENDPLADSLDDILLGPDHISNHPRPPTPTNVDLDLDSTVSSVGVRPVVAHQAQAPPRREYSAHAPQQPTTKKGPVRSEQSQKLYDEIRAGLNFGMGGAQFLQVQGLNLDDLLTDERSAVEDEPNTDPALAEDGEGWDVPGGAGGGTDWDFDALPPPPAGTALSQQELEEFL